MGALVNRPSERAAAAADAADAAAGRRAAASPRQLLLLHARADAPLADVRIKVEGGVVLPVHAMALVQHCGALARSSELFVGASPARPAALSSPFDEFAEADVARFLQCIYTAATAPEKEDVVQPAVVRLAHALDAAPVLAAARSHLLVRPLRSLPVSLLRDRPDRRAVWLV
jgi:hypothetical protein